MSIRFYISVIWLALVGVYIVCSICNRKKMELLGVVRDYEDILEVIDIVEHPRRQRNVRNRVDHFQKWNDEEFRNRFRLSKSIVQRVVAEISARISSRSDRNKALTATEMVLVTLRYLATGCMLVVVGDFHGIDKGTASRVIDKVTRAIAQLRPIYVRMPNIDDMEGVIQGFYNIAKFPRVIGAIDCTHVKIQSPGGDNAENFRNRKGFFSFNVQMVSDSSLKIRNIVCRWPGSAHDANIFRNSRIKTQFEDGEFESKFLLGDSGYGVKPYLLTPLANPQTEAQHLYNESHIRTRNVVERCFGVLKRRFPVLSLGIRLNVRKVEAVVVAAAVLHNIACDARDIEPAVDVEIEEAINFVGNVDNGLIGEPHNNEDGRNILIQQYFEGLINNI